MKKTLMISLNNYSFLLIGCPQYSGSGKAMTYYAKMLLECGFDVSILSYHKPHDVEHWPDRYAGLNFIKCIKRPVPFEATPYLGIDFSLVDAILTWIKKNQKKNIILWGHYLYPYGLAVLIASNLANEINSLKIFTWLTPAGSDIWNQKFKLPNLTASLLKITKNLKVFAYSPRFAREICHAFPYIKDLQIFPPIIDDEHFHPQMKYCRKDFTISIVSNMRPWKGIELVEDVLKMMGLQPFKPLLVFVGPKRKDIQISDFRTKWVGITSDTRQYYWQSHLTMNFSHHDSFNLTLAESALCGTPFVTSDTAGIIDFLGSAGNELLFSLKDENSIRNTGKIIKKIISEPEYYQTITEQLYCRVREKFGNSFRKQNFSSCLASFLS